MCASVCACVRVQLNWPLFGGRGDDGTRFATNGKPGGFPAGEIQQQGLIYRVLGKPTKESCPGLESALRYAALTACVFRAAHAVHVVLCLDVLCLMCCAGACLPA